MSLTKTPYVYFSLSKSAFSVTSIVRGDIKPHLSVPNLDDIGKTMVFLLR